jgi:flagellar export protein FliJ
MARGLLSTDSPVMKRFKFSLEALHVLRKRQEQAATEMYAKALLEREQAMQRLADLGREHDALADETRREMSAGCQADRLRLRQVFHDTLRQSIRRQEQVLARAETVIQQAMLALVHAKQQREAVDKAHDRQRSVYDRDAAREEAALLDELARRQLGPNIHGQFA